MTVESVSNTMRSNAARVPERLSGDRGNLTKADIMQVSRAMSEEYIARLRTQTMEGCLYKCRNAVLMGIGSDLSGSLSEGSQRG